MAGRAQEWTAQQCAAHRGTSRRVWLDDVQAGLEPPPTNEFRGAPRWRATEVRGWKRPDEWSAAECAAHHGVSAAKWVSLAGKGLVPGPVRRARESPLWSAESARSVRIDFQDPPQKPGWSARQCAMHHGISTPSWREAVRQGDAPAPSYDVGASKYWDPEQVKAASF